MRASFTPGKRGSPLYYRKINPNCGLFTDNFQNYYYILLERGPFKGYVTPGGSVNVVTTCGDWGYGVK